MGGLLAFGIIVVIAFICIAIASASLIEICQPNEVLIFSGSSDRRGYEIVHSGRKVRIPLLHRIDRLDVTNMTIDLNVTNAYSKGGIPLNIRGVANIKIGTQPRLLNNAIERFLGTSREQIMQVGKETLEGNLRGVLATLTPEEVNEDRRKFAQSLFEEATQDLHNLGLELDNLKIQSVNDDRGYLNSIGRRQSAELLRDSRIAEANNRSEASVRDAENQRKKAVAKIDAAKKIAQAEANRRILDARTKADAMVAEERSKVGTAIVRSRENINVQRARIEQTRRQLMADTVKPAEAKRAELQYQARANVAKIIEEGKANAQALHAIIDTWEQAGDAARPLFLLQQFDAILENMLSTVQDIKIDKITVIDSKISDVDRHASAPLRAASASEQIKQTLDLDLPKLLQGVAALQSS